MSRNSQLFTKDISHACKVLWAYRISGFEWAGISKKIMPLIRNHKAGSIGYENLKQALISPL